MTLPLALSVGDPAGIGPEVAVEGSLATRPAGGVVLVGDAEQLISRLGDAARRLPEEARDWTLATGEIGVLAAGDAVATGTVTAHRPTVEGGRAQLAYLERAASLVVEGRARALVTGPTSKEAIAASGTPFTGQTEHLARFAGLAADDVTMMFLGPRLKVALVTTHLAVADVPTAITASRLGRSVRHLGEALARFGIDRPKVVVSGLNPHAGEGGLFGLEEQRVVVPALRALRDDLGAALELVGPVPAEAALRDAVAGRCDGVVAMMHDQATIASKLVDFGHAVNVTWGLPFLRTSVDHGVAYDAARTGAADASGMRAAIRLADCLTSAKPRNSEMSSEKC